MRKSAWLAIGALVLAQTALAQIHLERDALLAIPPDDAVVLDPAGPWCLLDMSRFTRLTALDHAGGHPKVVVVEAAKQAFWFRELHLPFNPERYPIVTVTYRATGILPSARPAVRLGADGGERVAVALNQDLVADGEMHELLVDLRELDARGPLNSLEIMPHCRGPEPAVFELLGLRFESDHDLPPLAKRDEPEFSLQVVDANGQGVPEAMVTVDAERLNSSRSATTDTAGKVTLRAANNPMDEHALRVVKKGMATAYRQANKGGGFPKTVTLLRASPYGGTVRDAAGQPIANAVVHIGARSTHLQAGGQRWQATPLTDSTGRWRTSPLPVEHVSLSVSLQHSDYVSESLDTPPAAEMRQGAAALVMRRGSALQGTVLSPKREPVARAAVTQGPGRHYRGYASVRTDPNGRFAFPHRQLGKTTLIVEATGSAPAMVPLAVGSEMPDITVRLEPGHTLRGRVLDPVGKAVAGVAVAARSWREHDVMSWQTRTDGDGRFTWSGAPPDAVQFRFLKKGYMTVEKRALTATQEEHKIVLLPLLRISGTITDAATGDPIADCKVMPGTYYSAQAAHPHWDRHSARQCRDGRYTVSFDTVRPGLAVRVEAPGYLPGVSPKFLPEEGSHTLDFQLEKAAEIAGTIRLPDGNPAEGAEVYLLPPEGQLHFHGLGRREAAQCPSLETMADGSYRFPAVKGSWLLVAAHPGGYTEATPALYGESPDLHLEKWGRIEGTYHIGTKPVGGQGINVSLSLRWYVPGKPFRFPFIAHYLKGNTNERGHFTIDVVPPGRGTVGPYLKTGPGWRMSHGETYTLPAGGTARVTIGGTGLPLIGKLALPEGAAVKAAWQLSGPIVKTTLKKAVRPALTTQQGRRTFVGVMQADGSFRVNDVPAGDYTLSFTLHEPGKPPPRAGAAIGSLEHRFTVPPIPGGRNNEPLDLGTLTVTLD